MVKPETREDGMPDDEQPEEQDEISDLEAHFQKLVERERLDRGRFDGGRKEEGKAEDHLIEDPER